MSFTVTRLAIAMALLLLTAPLAAEAQGSITLRGFVNQAVSSCVM